MQYAIASGNAGKIREFEQVLSAGNYELIPQSQFNIESCAETGLTFVENAILKARHAAQHSGLAAIADDSGLIVDALHGAPGLYSARYAGEQATHADNIAKLLDELAVVDDNQRQARFCTVIVVLQHAADPLPRIYQGLWEGTILREPRGEGGFGYDPIFYVPTHNCSAAELDPRVKNSISHRGQALQLFKRDYG